MIKKKFNELNIDNLDDMNIDDIDYEIEKDIKDFHINLDEVENISLPEDIDIIIDQAIDRAEKDMKKEKIIKTIVPSAAAIAIMLSVGIYNPILAHEMPPIQKFLEGINHVLHVDEIAEITGLDKIVPKARLNKKGKIEFVTRGKDSIQEESKNNNKIKDEYVSNYQQEISKEIEETEEQVIAPIDDNETINLIHKMSNGIIVAELTRGYTEISPKTIQIALKGVSNMQDQSSRNYLYNELKKWENGDFSNGVEVHNYVWRKLDGEIGIATDLDHAEIEKIINKNFK